MLKLLQSRAVLMLWAGAIATLGTGCNFLPASSPTSQSNPADTASLPDAAPTQPVEPASTTPTTSTTSTPSPTQNSAPETSPPNDPVAPDTAEPAPQANPAYDPYPDAVNRASAAFTLSQSAQSQDDWRLVSSRWQQAIELMAAVPSSSPNHATAQTKLTEYRRNLTYAREQAAMPIPEIAAGDNVITIPITSAEVSSGNRSGNSREPQRSSSTSVAGLPQENGVFTAPIVRRSGGTPVVLVTFNGNQTFEMIVDTGASGTVITQPMARLLNVTPVGSTNVATASASNVTFMLGYISSMEVAGAQAQNVLVAIAGPELGTGLLGHDFFGNYDVTVRENVVEFRER